MTMLEIDNLLTSLPYLTTPTVEVKPPRAPARAVFADAGRLADLARRTGIPLDAWIRGVRRK